MKKLAVGLIILLPPLGWSAPIGLMPDQRTPVVISEKERNPFGVRQTTTQEVLDDTQTEETQIRSIIAKLPISGIIRGPAKVKVLLGSMILEAGNKVPPVLPNQSEILLVLSVAPHHVELGFQEKDGTANARKIILSPDLTPRVRYMLESESASSASEMNAGKSALGGVVKKNGPPTPVQ